MASSLKIEIETESEEGIYPLLQHIFREITEGQEYNNPVDSGYIIEDGWLVMEKGPLNGKYQWSKK